MLMHAFNGGAVELIEMILARGDAHRAVLFKTVLTTTDKETGNSNQRRVQFLVYRPNSYTKVYVDDDRAGDMSEIRGRPSLAPWRLICDHDSCWREWYNYTGNHNEVSFQSNVEVESVSVLGTVVQDQDKGFFMNPSLLERLLPGTGNLDATYTPLRDINAAGWYGYIFDTFLAEMRRLKHNVETLDFELWAHKRHTKTGGVNKGELHYEVKDGLPVLTGVEYGRRPSKLPRGKGTGTIQGDVYKFLWEHWKRPDDFDLNMGSFTRCGSPPWAPWGL